MILVAALLGAVLALGLLEWETRTRAEQAQFLPTPTARPAQLTPTAAGGALPPGKPETAASGGAAVFAGKCNACHPDGGAGAGPPVRGADFAAKYPGDAELKQVIRDGRGAMPAYPATALSDAELNDLVGYIRSLR